MITFTIFCIALLGIMFLFANKKRELETGVAYIFISHVNEAYFKEKFSGLVVATKESPRKIANVSAFLAVKSGVHIFEKTKQIVYPKISHIVDAVKGRDIPKNKGTVSLFLKHVEGFRDSK